MKKETANGCRCSCWVAPSFEKLPFHLCWPKVSGYGTTKERKSAAQKQVMLKLENNQVQMKQNGNQCLKQAKSLYDCIKLWE